MRTVEARHAGWKGRGGWVRQHYDPPPQTAQRKTRCRVGQSTTGLILRWDHGRRFDVFVDTQILMLVQVRWRTGELDPCEKKDV